MKFAIGIAFMIGCVIFVACPEPRSLYTENLTDNNYLFLAIGLGLLAPLFISLFISISRYWTITYGYKSQDFTIDTFMMMAILEIYFFFNY
jgi:hypothetical protein